jgi:asparagine synthase (glutamine-hydrolysing)
MCGINILVTKENHSQLSKSISKMNDSIIHRGPDDDGIFIHDQVALGMRRLSIIDLVSGNQPILSENKNIIIVFNGEIYNYKEIQQNLIDNGFKFKTNSDTEVILKGYEFYGIDILKKLNGMFAFAIYDISKKKIYLSRDRLGEKPLFYYCDHKTMIFSSELKSLISILPDFKISKLKLSKPAINLYFSLSYIPSPHTIYSNVFKLEPGSYMTVDLSIFKIEHTKYWNIDNSDIIQPTLDYTSAKLKIHDLLFDSVEKRMISDVPIGSFLSGGVDSSIITAIMAKISSSKSINTFSLVSKNKNFDESVRSNSVSKYLKTIHNPIFIEDDELLCYYENILANFDEPFGDSSAIPTFFISKESKKFVKVVLTGDGGDEVFGGYNRYLMPTLSKNYKQFIPKLIHNKIIKPTINSIKQTSDKRGLLFKVKKLINGVGDSEFEDIINIMSLGYIDNERKLLLNKDYYSNTNDDLLKPLYDSADKMSLLNKSRYLDLLISLEGDMLTKVDRSSMLASLECRAPLLDHRIVEFSFQLPSDFLIKNHNTKYILKDTFKHLLPKGLFDLPKCGFGVPVGEWLRNEFKDDLINLTNSDFLNEQDIFNPYYLQNLVNQHLCRTNDHTFKLWTVFCFQKWYKNNF